MTDQVYGSKLSKNENFVTRIYMHFKPNDVLEANSPSDFTIKKIWNGSGRHCKIHFNGCITTRSLLHIGLFARNLTHKLRTTSAETDLPPGFTFSENPRWLRALFWKLV